GDVIPGDVVGSGYRRQLPETHQRQLRLLQQSDQCLCAPVFERCNAALRATGAVRDQQHPGSTSGAARHGNLPACSPGADYCESVCRTVSIHFLSPPESQPLCPGIATVSGERGRMQRKVLEASRRRSSRATLSAANDAANKLRAGPGSQTAPGPPFTTGRVVRDPGCRVLTEGTIPRAEADAATAYGLWKNPRERTGKGGSKSSFSV